MKKHLGYALFCVFITLSLSACSSSSDDGGGSSSSQKNGDTGAAQNVTFVIPLYSIGPRAEGADVIWRTDKPAKGRIEVWSPQGLVSAYEENEEKVLHRIAITGLEPGVRYRCFIRPPAEGSPPADGKCSFWTAPKPGRFFTFFAYGDTRTQADAHGRVCEQLAAHVKSTTSPAFLLHTGDFVSDGRREDQWKEQFFDPAASVLSEAALVPCLGNHEYHSEWYYRYFGLGGVFPGEPNGSWYSFQFGCAHFVILDATSDFGPESDQYRWLVEDLQSDQAQEASWRIAVFHRPAFSSGLHGGTPSVQQILVPLFEQKGVQLVLNGHDHLYERLHQNGVTYIVTGGGGAPLYSLRDPRDPRSQAGESAHHFCRFAVGPELIEGWAYRATGSLLDHFTINAK